MTNDFIAQLSEADIERAAHQMRAELGYAETIRLPMVEILELGIPRLYPGCEIHVDPAEQLGDVEAYVANHPPRLVLSDRTYARAWDDEARMRFTLAHEFGHLKLHLHYLSGPDGKAPRGSTRRSFLAMSERQANRFAVHFLLPGWLVRKFPDQDALANASGVSKAAAKRRLQELGLCPEPEKSEYIPSGFQDLLARIGTDEAPKQNTGVQKTRIENWGQISYDKEKDEFSAVVRAGVKPVPSAPIGVGWVIIGSCNQECIICYGNAEALPRNTLSLSECLRVVDAIKDAGIMRVVISGGEPLLLPHLPHVVQALAVKDISVVVGTNGTLLSDENIEALRGCTRIEISLDAPTAALNNRLRPSRSVKGNAWAEAIRAIRLCLRLGIKVRVLTTLNNMNQELLVGMAALLQEIGVSDWAISWTIPAGRAAPIFKNITPEAQIVDRQLLQIRVYFPSLKVRYSHRGQESNRFYYLILPDGQIATQDVQTGNKVIYGSALTNALNSPWTSEKFDQSAHFDKWIAGRIVRTYD